MELLIETRQCWEIAGKVPSQVYRASAMHHFEINFRFTSCNHLYLIINQLTKLTYVYNIIRFLMD